MSSLLPAATVIPMPIAYIKVVAVEKVVVAFVAEFIVRGINWRAAGHPVDGPNSTIIDGFGGSSWLVKHKLNNAACSKVDGSQLTDSC